MNNHFPAGNGDNNVMPRRQRPIQTQIPNGNSQRWLTPFIILSLVILCVLAFWPAMSNAFLNWDDDRNFAENMSFRGLGLQQMQWAWRTYHLGVWQPLAWILLGFEYAIFSLNPIGYHVISLAIHIVNTVLIYFVCLTLMTCRPNRKDLNAIVLRVSAAAATVLFAIHPLRVEAVAWVSCQPYLPAITFFLFAILAYVHLHSRQHHSWRVPAAAAFGLYLIAVGFKAVAVSLPFVLLILDLFPLGRWQRGFRCAFSLLVEKLPFFLVAIWVSWQAMAAKDFTHSRAPFHECYPAERLAHAALGTWFYFVKSIWPTDLIAFYRLPNDIAITTPIALIAAAAIGLLTGILLLLRRRNSGPLAAWLSYLIIILPNVGLIQISTQLAADRYGYLALIGPVVLLAALFNSIGNRITKTNLVLICWFGLVACSGVLLVRTREQCRMWKDSETLWRATLDVDPLCAVARCNLGEALVKLNRFAEASEQLSKAIDIDSRFSFAYANLGVILCQAKKYRQAVDFGEQAISIQPGLTGLDLARAHAMLGQAYAGLRQDDAAWKHTRTAQKLGLAEAQKMIDYLSKLSKEPEEKLPPQ